MLLIDWPKRLRDLLTKLILATYHDELLAEYRYESGDVVEYVATVDPDSSVQLPVARIHKDNGNGRQRRS